MFSIALYVSSNPESWVIIRRSQEKTVGRRLRRLRAEYSLKRRLSLCPHDDLPTESSFRRDRCAEMRPV
ncbi:hypothetical protein TNCV_1778631 [Trichonephila clavipes]|nr:hypothetical protein TNCV_1778631 [Trichonephila clavipes]